jgi:hypothetical protein
MRWFSASARCIPCSERLVKEVNPDQLGLPAIEALWQDVRYAAQTLRRSPGFATAAILTLALGIGVNTAIFSVVNGVLLSPLPYPEPDRLVALYSRTADARRASSSYPNFLDWVRDNRSFSYLAAFREDDLNLIGLGQPERVPAEMVSASFFRLLAVRVGIYGVISHLVGERTHEIAIRMALGAERRDVSRMVLRDGAKMALAGVALGLVAALGLTRLMTSMLFGVSAHDPVTVVGVMSLLTLVTFAACSIPARRATRVDPVVALRNN